MSNNIDRIILYLSIVLSFVIAGAGIYFYVVTFDEDNNTVASLQLLNISILTVLLFFLCTISINFDEKSKLSMKILMILVSLIIFLSCIIPSFIDNITIDIFLAILPLCLLFFLLILWCSLTLTRRIYVKFELSSNLLT